MVWLVLDLVLLSVSCDNFIRSSHSVYDSFFSFWTSDVDTN